jgi:RimJ/RimL family protein N-acetyltransferase
MGLASESVALLTEWALAQPGVSAVCARVEPGNAPSVRVLERFGFTADGQSGDHLRYVVRSSRPLRGRS